MKRTQFKKSTKQLKRSAFKRKPHKTLKRASKAKIGGNKEKIQAISKLKNELYKKSHTYIRKRDSISNNTIAGFCVDCGKYAEGKDFQAGHFIPDAAGGAILRYHPHNMHGQSSGCNMKVSQERVKIEYTIKMQDKYGIDYVNFLRSLKNKTIKADEIFYKKMIELYDTGNENEIINYLHSLI